MVICVYQIAHLMRGQKSPMTQRKIEVAFARLDRLGLGEDDESVVNAQESLRRADLFTSVTPVLPCDLILTPS